MKTRFVKFVQGTCERPVGGMRTFLEIPRLNITVSFDRDLKGNVRTESFENFPIRLPEGAYVLLGDVQVEIDDSDICELVRSAYSARRTRDLFSSLETVVLREHVHRRKAELIREQTCQVVPV